MRDPCGSRFFAARATDCMANTGGRADARRSRSTPVLDMPRTSRSATPVHAVPGKAARFDVIHAADLSRSSHAGLRVAPEAETAAAAGYQVGLLHLAQAGPTSPIAPEVLSAVRRHGLSIVDPEAHVGTRLLVIHVSGDPDAVLARAARVRAERIVVVSSESAFAPNVRPFPGEKMDREPWPIVAGAELQEARVPRQTGLRIGFLGTQGSAPELIRAMGGVNSGSSVQASPNSSRENGVSATTRV